MPLPTTGFLLLAAAAGQASEGTVPPLWDGSLAQAEVQALDGHPELRAARAAARSAEAGVVQAGGLPEPTVGVGVFLRPVETRTGPQQARVSIQQPLPWPSAVRAERDAAAARLDSVLATVQDRERVLRARVQATYWDLWEVRARVHVLSGHLAMLEGLVTSVRGRLSAGELPLSALQQVELERAQLADRIATLQAREETVEVRLATLVGVPLGSRLPTHDEPPPPQSPTLDLPALSTLLTTAHPIQAAVSNEAAAAAEVKGAQVARRPRVSLRADWILVGPSELADPMESGQDALVLGTGLTLPTSWRARTARVDDMRARADRSRAQTDAVMRQLQSRLADHLTAVEDSARSLLLTRDVLVPEALAALTSTQGEFVAGRTPLADVLFAQRTLFDLQLALVRHQAAHARAWSALDAVLATAPTRREAS